MKIVAFQGAEGAYSHLACTHVFPDYVAKPCGSFYDAMQMVSLGQAEYAVIPFENSTAGRVEEMYRLLPKTNLHIIAEYFQPINHCLVGVKGAKIADLKQVGSHPQALAQCAENIRKLNLEPLSRADTASFACEVSKQKDVKVAGIASKLAAELYDMDILAENFQDKEGNTTRFLIFAREKEFVAYEKDQAYITSMMFRVKNMPAVLYKALGGFATNGINLTKLESYMLDGDFRATGFYVDAQGHIDSEDMQRALEELSFYVKEVKVLGCFKQHEFRIEK